MTDYIACGRVVPERIAAIVKGIAEGCVAGRAARWSAARPPSTPGCSAPDEYDVAGAATGVVEADQLLGPGPGAARRRASSRWPRAGCTPTATRWCGTCCSTQAGWALDRDVAELGRTLGEELLEPTRIYAKACLALARDAADVHAMAHITGGGLAANLARVLPAGARGDHRPRHLDARSRSSTWSAALGRRAPSRARAHAQHGRRHGRRASPPATPTGRSRCSPSAACRPGCAGEVLGRRRRRRRSSCEGATWPDGVSDRRCLTVQSSSSSSPSSAYSAYGSSTSSASSSVQRRRRRWPAGVRPRARRCSASRSVPCELYFSSRAPWSAWPWPGRAPWLDPLIVTGHGPGRRRLAIDSCGTDGCSVDVLLTVQARRPVRAPDAARAGPSRRRPGQQHARPGGLPPSAARRAGRRPPPAGRPRPRRASKHPARWCRRSRPPSARARSKSKPSSSSATWITPPAFTQ